MIDPFENKILCNTLAEFPSNNGRHGMVGEYIGHGSAVFCGGSSNSGKYVPNAVYHDCKRYLYTFNQNLITEMGRSSSIALYFSLNKFFL